MKSPSGLLSGAGEPRLPHSAIPRAVGYFALWLVLAGGGNPSDLAAGAAAALAATWVSLYFLPPGGVSVRLTALPRFVLRFLYRSVVAGVDVARRALDPRLPLHPGFVVYPVGIPPGPMRTIFTSLMSLLPGTVPIGSATGGGLLIHCLDVEQPITTGLAAEEALFSSVVRWRHDHG
jgi:multicomponent Na+:H+ antiporter subunit E